MSRSVSRLSVGACLSAAMAMAAFASAGLRAQGGANAVHACVTKIIGTVRIVPAEEVCKTNESRLDWNIEGPAGPQGVPGPIGPQGPQGPQGAQGPAGSPATTPARQVIGEIKLFDSINVAVPIYGFNVATDVADSHLATGGIGGARPEFTDFGILKDIDQLSVRIWEAAATGRHFQRAEIQIFAPGDTLPLVSYRLDDVLVTSVHFDTGPTEHLTLNFSKICTTVAVGASPSTYCFDVRLNKAV